ncbi:hypothetical protein BN140_0536 [Methanoculleus bourgensis MS2]|uniref:S-layer protein n=1 Tax=Methanoculleus bourgensis (strain ATCC 43281 / DSM 3045 / OCM 15 / MS2) TaxID=1201294 RepID=I7LLL4_METBM|nr:hypothetical protein [Methanoculleus bourgensis]CCJ35459.1 hypothetical protein BN140_0536 [Methanoculleus bourgensis MS2]
MNLIARVTMVVAVVLAAAIVCQPVSAAGIAVGPSSQTIENALRGGSFERSLTIFNPSDMGFDVVLKTEGSAKDWIKFSAIDGSEEIQKVYAPKKGQIPVLLRVKVPDDAANDRYTAKVVVETVPGEKVPGSVGMVLQATSALEITVTDVEKVSGEVTSIVVRDTEVDIPLGVEVGFKNTGNVVVTPEITAVISRDGTVIDTISEAKTPVRPTFTERIVVHWPNEGLAAGTYQADVTVSLRGAVLAEEGRTFAILPLGSLTRQGELTDLGYEGALTVGKPIKITGLFKNSGSIATRARLSGEVYRGGSLVDVISGDEMTVLVFSENPLTAYYTPKEPGEYTMKTCAVFEGKTTDSKDMVFTVQPDSSGLSLPLSPVPVIAALAFIGLFAAGRRNRENR